MRRVERTKGRVYLLAKRHQKHETLENMQALQQAAREHGQAVMDDAMLRATK
jgi:hypothetical protein